MSVRSRSSGTGSQLVLPERGLRVSDCPIEIAAGRGEQCSAARGRRPHPGPSEPLARLLPCDQDRLGILQPADRDQRLDRVGDTRDVR